MKLIFFCIMILAFSPAPALAETEVTAALVSPISPDAISDMGTDELLFEFDARQVENAKPIPFTLEDLRKQSELMQSDTYKELLNEKVIMPFSTANATDVELLRGFSDEEIAKFIGRKTKYLDHISTLLSVFQLAPKSINRIVALANDQFFRHAKVVTNATTVSGGFGFGIGGGLGLPDWLMNQLRKSKMLKNLPERVGFYYALSTGIAMTRTVKDGKTKIRIEPFIEFRQAERILGPFANFGAAIFTGVAIEAPDDAVVQRSKFVTLYRFGIRSNETRVAVGMSLIGFGFAFMGNMLAGIQGESTAFELNREGVKLLIETIKEKLRPRKRAITCRQIFAGH